MAANQTRVYYVCSTHWDREWYEPFQHFRYHLVETLDEVLDLMRRDRRFACFQTDGQSIIVEDYVEMRPERLDEVRELAAQGRLRIGPWYTMPDEHIVGGESLLRNLEEGIRVARDFGNVSRVGFVCDIFGHCSQLPQILLGFGIDNAFLFRGVNEDTERGVFLWQAPDGSEVVTYRFGPREGYFDFGAFVRGAFDVDTPFDFERATDRIVEYLAIQQQRLGLPDVLFFDGGDHMPIEPRISELLEAFRRRRPDVDVRHTGLDEYAAALSRQRDRIPRMLRGELRQPGRLVGDGTWLIPGVLSSRVRLKQANRACETQLCWWVEPYAHLAAMFSGPAYPHTFIRHSWRYLLQNHAHDSICGCSPDQVHKDMEFRFDQSRLINTKLIETSLAHVARRVEIPDLGGEDFAVVVFNPSQAPLDGPVDLELWFDHQTSSRYHEFFGYEQKIGFRLYTPDGTELPYDYLEYHPLRRRFRRPHRKTARCDEYITVRVAVPLEIPAFGYTTIICRPAAEPTRHPTGGLVASDRALENEHLRVTVSDNGSLSLLDKRTGQTYDRLLIFEERADIGDGWYHGVAVNDQILTSTGAAADVALVEHGAWRATLRVSLRMRVPESFEFDGPMRRSNRTRELPIDTWITLRKGADYLEVRTVVDNCVRDHRLRVLFESGAETTTYLADSPFDVIEREIALPADNHTYKELAVDTRPQASWTAVFDERRGLAVVAPDLSETAVLDLPGRPLALTLLRGFRRTVFTDGEEGGQSLGRHEFNYCLVPLVGPPTASRMARLAQRTIAGTRSVIVTARDQAPTDERKLPVSFGQLSLDPGEVVVSALRRFPADDSTLELRVFNPTDESVTENVTLAWPIAAARLVDFEGRELETLSLSGPRRFTLCVPARRIVTVHLELKRE